MKKLFLLILLSCWIIPGSFAQSNKTFTVEGKVVLKNSTDPIPFAQVLIKEISQWGFTDENGRFKISGVFSGNYTFQVTALGYVTYECPISVSKDIKAFTVQMQEDNLTLDEIVVTAKSGGTINSSNKIGKKAIEHIQASSIADVMQLLPGGIIQNPKLTDVNRIQIRSAGDDVSNNNARGVGFLVNGAQISTDASMSDAAKSGGVGIPTLDFRSFSTDNIESIQVLKGVVSAEYGDMTSGAVLVTTKAGRTPYEVRFKADPNTKAVSANKGFSLSKHAGYMNIDFDYARATKDLRSPVVTFDRTNIGLTYSNTFNHDRKPFRLNARLTGSFTANSTKSDPDVARDDYTKVRNKNIMLSLYGNWMINKSWISILNYNVSASYALNTTRDYLVKTDVSLPTTDARESGLHLGSFTEPNQIRDKRIEDIPVYVNAKLSGILNKKIGKTLFKTTLGVEFNSKGNLGEGLRYEGMQPQYFRHHKYSETPFMNDFSAFLEEKITIPISTTSLELSAGARFTKMAIAGYSYDPILDPRFNAKYFIIKNKRNSLVRDFALRGGWGMMRKLPSISLLYPGETYLDRAVFQYTNTVTNESMAVISTTVLPELLDYNIATAKTRNMEIGADLTIGGIEIGLTYFNEYLKDGISANSSYETETIKYYNAVTDQGASPKFEDGKVFIKDKTGTYVEAPYRMSNEFISHAVPDNRLEQSKWGIEYDFNFGKIKSINTSIIVNGAYIKSHNYSTGIRRFYLGGSDPVDVKEDFPYVSLFAGDNDNSSGVSRSRLSTNINLVTNIPKIRMVVSLTTQCIWMDREWVDYDNGNMYYIGDDGKPVYEDFSKRLTDGQLLYRDPVAYMDFEGNVRPFSDYHTTTDADLKARLGKMRYVSNFPYRYAVQSYKPYFMANIRVTKEIGKLAAISFYANNFTNSKPMIANSARPNIPGVRKNTDIYFGAELRLTF